MVFPSRLLGYEPGKADHKFHPRFLSFYKVKLFKVAISLDVCCQGVLGSFSGGEKCAFYSKSLIIVVQKLRHNLGFLDTAYRLCASVSIVSQRFCETLDLMTTRLEWLIK